MERSEPQRAYAWFWLPGSTSPVVMGRLDKRGESIHFTYGDSYLARPEAMPLYLPDLPLRRGAIPPNVGEIAGPINDATPDAWGRRVIMNRLLRKGSAYDLSRLVYLLESGSDRFGALDFQESATEYIPRSHGEASLTDLMRATQMVDDGEVLPPALQDALLRGSSIGGARPKALLDDGDRNFIAKFSSATDDYPVVKSEFVAMELARCAGLNVTPVKYRSVRNKGALLVERFDRPDGGGRRMAVSAGTVLALDDFLGARYQSYADLADIIRQRFTDPKATLRELFSRIVFNVLVGNTDDHMRNHAAFWNGSVLTLTPAFDICPQARSGGEVRQSMAIGEDGYRDSRLAGCIDRASKYLLNELDARAIVDHQVEVIRTEWTQVCDLGEITAAEKAFLWGRQFLNPYCLEDY